MSGPINEPAPARRAKSDDEARALLAGAGTITPLTDLIQQIAGASVQEPASKPSPETKHDQPEDKLKLSPSMRTFSVLVRKWLWASEQKHDAGDGKGPPQDPIFGKPVEKAIITARYEAECPRGEDKDQVLKLSQFWKLMREVFTLNFTGRQDKMVEFPAIEEARKQFSLWLSLKPVHRVREARLVKTKKRQAGGTKYIDHIVDWFSMYFEVPPEREVLASRITDMAGTMRFDLAFCHEGLKLVIERDGEQHFDPELTFGEHVEEHTDPTQEYKVDKYEAGVRRDIVKTVAAIRAGYTVIRIGYNLKTATAIHRFLNFAAIHPECNYIISNKTMYGYYLAEVNKLFPDGVLKPIWEREY